MEIAGPAKMKTDPTRVGSANCCKFMDQCVSEKISSA